MEGNKVIHKKTTLTNDVTNLGKFVAPVVPCDVLMKLKRTFEMGCDYIVIIIQL